jgi:two-component system sporulation sensor kinase A
MILATGVFRYRKSFDILAQAREKLEMHSRTAAEIAHEIKNPLSAIRGATQLQAEMVMELNVDKVRQYQEIIDEELQRIEEILNGLLDLTKPLKINREPVKVNDLIEKTVRLVNTENIGLEIGLMLDDGLPEVAVDPSLMHQVFLNLIKNASEAGSEGTNLEIRTFIDRDLFYIEFTDDGPGVSEEIRERIFEPFFTTKESGFGLGLVLVSRIIEAHGGMVSIENHPPVGAKVSIQLPR